MPIFSEVEKATASFRAAKDIWTSSAAFAASEIARTELRRMGDWQDAYPSSALDFVMKEQRRFELMRASLEPSGLLVLREIEEQQARLHKLAGYSDVSMSLHRELERQKRFSALTMRASVEQALSAAERASCYALPDALELYRSPTNLLATRLSAVQSTSWWQEARHLDAFTLASSMADALHHAGFHESVEKAVQAFTTSPIPELSTLSQHRAFLDAAGLALPRWPRWRILSRSEKRARLGEKLRRYAPSAYVLKAQSLVHRHELALRDAIDCIMTVAFGEEWWIERLPACDCKDLLGRWKKRGGNVLDHADYAHYALIMCHPDHHGAGFDVGFPDRDALGRLLSDAGELRAASHHPRHEAARFTAKDLRNLRIVWVAIKEGLTSLEPDEEFDF